VTGEPGPGFDSFSSGSLSGRLLGIRQFPFLFRSNVRTFLYFLFAARRIDKPLLRRIESIGGFGIAFAMIRR
jgi:hypothetical protein